MSRLIPESFIDDLLARTDIVDVIDPHVHLQRAGRDHKGLCPFHDEKTPSFTVSQEKQFYHCFGCGAHGTAIGFLMQFSNLGFVEAVTELATMAGMEIPQEPGQSQPTEQYRLLFELHDSAARYYSQQLRNHANSEQAISYLKGRGISGETARDFGIGYAPPGWSSLFDALGTNDEKQRGLIQCGLAIRKTEHQCYDRFRDRIMFPIHDQRGRIVGFGGRIIDQGEPKYLNSPETPIFHKGRELYNLHRARQPARDAQRILVVEGYLDVIALAQHGVQNAVATLGTATTVDHLERLFRTTTEISFCFDGDAAGRRAAWRALTITLPLLREGRYASFLFLPSGEDPDTLVRGEGPERFHDAASYTSLAEFLFAHLRESIDLRSIDGRARLLDTTKPLIDKIPPGAYRRLLEEQLASLTQLPARDVATLIAGNSTVPAAPARRAFRTETRQAPSLVRSAIRLLLVRPDLVAHLGDTAWIARVALPGADLLANLAQIAALHPGISGAALVERFRNSPEGVHLARLLASETAIPPEALEQEFLGAVGQMRQMIGRDTTPLPENKPPSELSEQDKQAYRQHISDLANRR